MVEEFVRPAYVLEPLEGELRDDGAELAARGRDPVRGRPVARRERLAGDYERRRVRPEVREEVREAVQEHERLRARARARVRALRRRPHRVERGACQCWHPDEFEELTVSNAS